MSKTIEYLQNQIRANLEANKRLAKQIEEEKKLPENWYYTDDVLTLSDGVDELKVCCDYGSYREVKEDGHLDDFIYIGFEDVSESMSLGIDSAKELRDYLTKVINYMEE